MVKNRFLRHIRDSIMSFLMVCTKKKMEIKNHQGVGVAGLPMAVSATDSINDSV